MYGKVEKGFIGLFADMAERLLDKICFIGFTVVLLFSSFFYLKDALKKRRDILTQMFNAGVKTLPVVSIVAVFTGMILSLQIGVEMRVFQQQNFIGHTIMVMLTREMGPFISGIILIASMGAAIAAEIGTMKVSEEIDALELMSISPVKFLVMPRVTAMAVMTPIVTIYIIFLGAIGGAVVANAQLNVPYNIYYYNAIHGLHLKAIYTGLLKAHIFGLVISSISCAYGLNASNGALGVGKATRDSVVASFIFVLITGYIITSIFYSGSKL